MSRKMILHTVRVGIVAAIFAGGYLCGSVTGRSANAQMGDLGTQLLQKATESGGMLGSVAELGTTITDMQKNVSALQKNIEVLKKVQTALGGK